MAAKKTALITGASGGIGLELAHVFAKNRYDLWLVARNTAKLEEIQKNLAGQYSASVRVLSKDLSSASAAQEVFDAAQKEKACIDVLVNNAGMGFFGLFSETELPQHEQVMNLNMLNLTQMTKLFLGPMLERKSGKILNVASTAAFQPGPLLAVYYASKAYVLHFSEALANELKGSGVTVTTLCPGPTQTGFQEAAKMGSSKLFKGILVRVMDARQVAETGYRGLMKGKTVVIPGLPNKIIAFSTRFAPRAFITALTRKIQEK